MLTNSPLTNLPSYGRFDRDPPTAPHAAVLLKSNRRPRVGESQYDRVGESQYDHAGQWLRPLVDRRVPAAADRTVEIFPADIVKRRAVSWDGMTAEIVQATRPERTKYRFNGPRHLLAVYEQGERRDGETLVGGLPRSTLRDFKRKLVFVPAGHEYSDWQEPSALTRVVYFYFDPSKMPTLPQTDTAGTTLSPRLFFEDTTLWDTAVKLRKQIESAGSDNRLYSEALGVVLAHELVRFNAGICPVEAPVRGGLAGWQQRIVTTYIEEHLYEQIPLATLARLVRLSPYYFCRVFKQSLGMPPHRYHSSRRIEQAKTLLAKPELSVTEIGLTLGFSETSSFTAAFRRAAGQTPTAYHRSLG
jgi:AraC family transcriptional regulator